MRLFLMFLMAFPLLWSVGCSRQNRPEASGQTDIPAESDEDPNEILISVNGNNLTRGEALRQVNLRLGGPPPPEMPAERVIAIRNKVLSTVVDEFVKRILLMKEADRRGIEAGEDEINEAIEKIRSRAPDGNLPQGILKQGPAGRDSLRNEVITGIRVEKLLAEVLPESTEPSAEEIEAFMALHADKLTLPERVQARHILMAVTPGETEDSKALKKEKAQAIRERLLQGEDFAAVAAELSDCPSAMRGGDLGVFPRGKMEGVFEAAAFTQKESEIGEIVETPFGFHIIRVEKHLPPGLADTSEVESILKQRARAMALADYILTLHKTAEIKHSASIRPPPHPPTAP